MFEEAVQVKKNVLSSFIDFENTEHNWLALNIWEVETGLLCVLNENWKNNGSTVQSRLRYFNMVKFEPEKVFYSWFIERLKQQLTTWRAYFLLLDVLWNFYLFTSVIMLTNWKMHFKRIILFGTAISILMIQCVGIKMWQDLAMIQKWPWNQDPFLNVILSYTW